MNLAGYIDHTLLKPDTTKEQVEQLCKEALHHRFASVCTNGVYTSLVSKLLEGSGVKTCTVIGFPLGAMSTQAKVEETKLAVQDGAEEIDMVISIGLLKAKEDDEVKKDIEAVVKAAQPKAEVKVIIETCLLTKEEKERVCRLSMEAGAAFVKTSTGFSTGGATIEDVKLMKSIVGNKLKVKASGGVRTKEDAIALIEAGADRIGTSSGVKMI